MKKYEIPNKIEKHLRKNKKAWSRKGLVAILTYTIVVILTSLFVKSMWDGYWRTHSWKFQSPVIFQTPVIIKEVKPQAQKALVPEIDSKLQGSAKLEPKITTVPKSEEQIVKEMKHGEVLWKVYGLESTWGRADYCRNNNLGYAGYGVLNEGKIVCYESFAKATERAEFWLVKNGLEEKPLANVLCIWNQGVDTNECNYVKSYMSL